MTKIKAESITEANGLQVLELNEKRLGGNQYMGG